MHVIASTRASFSWLSKTHLLMWDGHHRKGSSDISTVSCQVEDSYDRQLIDIVMTLGLAGINVNISLDSLAARFHPVGWCKPRAVTAVPSDGSLARHIHFYLASTKFR